MRLHVAGVGASAGGLEAMTVLFAGLRPTGRMAWLVAQHMGPSAHADLLVRVLARTSGLPIAVATSGARLEPDRIAVIPGGWDGLVEGGVVRLREPGPDTLSTPSVNALFESLALALGPRAVGVVLSGTGSDGRTGCRQLKEHGGRTFAQDPAEARFPGMPAAAIEAGAIDQVLPAAEMARALGALFPPRAEPPAADPGELQRLLPLVLARTGLDFGGYKEETLLRRLEKRKAALGVADYAEHVRRHPEELAILQQQFLVSVSSFFRDRESFEALARALDVRPDLPEVRIWVPGCATGEEAWSLALLLLERKRRVRVVGTDLNAEALAIARAGVYRPAAFREMDPEWRSRYFTRVDGDYAVGSALREVVEFEQQDAFEGPPGGGFALVSCRNLLIYLKRPLQDRLLATFHEALIPRGLLFLGPAESLGFESTSRFTVLDPAHSLYQKRARTG